MKQFYVKFLAATLCMGAFVSGSAEDKLVLTHTVNGSVEYKLTDLQKITFSGDSINLVSADRTDAHHMDQVSKMHFDLSSSVSDNLQTRLGDVQVTVSGGVLTVTAADDAQVNLAVFSMSGRQVASVQAPGSASVNFNGYAPGVYVVKANGKTIKFVR